MELKKQLLNKYSLIGIISEANVAKLSVWKKEIKFS